MGMRDVSHSKELKVFIKGAFVLIGLIFILSYGVAVILLHFNRNTEINKNYEISKNIDSDKTIEIEKTVEIGKENIIGINLECKVFVLVLILVIFPILVFLCVFIGFPFLFDFYYKNLLNQKESINLQDLEQKFKNQKIEIQDIEKNLEHRIDVSTDSCIKTINKIKSDSKENLVAFLENLKTINDLLSKWKCNNS